MFVGVFSEMSRENYAGDMVNFNYKSSLDVRNLISFYLIFFAEIERTKISNVIRSTPISLKANLNISKDCMTEKLELERRLAIALGLLASCQLELTGCGRQAADDNKWWGRMVLASAIR